jgi:hypothetical protein
METRVLSEADSSSGKKRKAEAMELYEPLVTGPRDAKVIELQPDADVTLKVTKGNDTLDIKVSSGLLSLASKVFKAMLNSQFIEASTKVIELNDDKPQTILDFCRIIHHQCDAVTGMDATRMRELIMLADMRDCKEALGPWMVSQMVDYLAWFKSDSVCAYPGSVMPDSLPGMKIEDFITFAAVFSLDDLFFRATMAYFVRGRGQIVSSDCTKLAGTTAPIESYGISVYGMSSKSSPK